MTFDCRQPRKYVIIFIEYTNSSSGIVVVVVAAYRRITSGAIVSVGG